MDAVTPWEAGSLDHAVQRGSVYVVGTDVPERIVPVVNVGCTSSDAC